MKIPKLGIIIPKMGISKKFSLGTALFPGVQLRLLGLLFGHPDRYFQITDLIRLGGGGKGATQRELEKLSSVGLVTTETEGKRKRYKANKRAPVYKEVRGIILKTVGLLEPLKEALQPHRPEIAVAFVYGSIAKGHDTARSDIDLMIVSNSLSYSDVFGSLQQAEKLLQRTIHPNLATPEGWKKKIDEQNSFTTRVSQQPKLFVIGDERELARIRQSGSCQLS